MGLTRELPDLIKDLANGAYPRFVTNGTVEPELPVFLYHRVDPVQFEDSLSYLRDNGYQSVSADEHHDALTGACDVPPRSVVLAFDDGLADLYTTAFPLLRKYGLKAVAFIIPARVGMPDMVTWDQLREMHDSGLVDIQSHSMHHVSIPISPKELDFRHPRYAVYHSWQYPVDPEWRWGIPPEIPALGTPILRNASRLAGSPRYYPNAAGELACAEYVAANGKEDFFRRQGWRKSLRAVYSEACTVAGGNGRYETPDEQREAIRRELEESKIAIEGQIPGKTVRHLAFPWNEVGQITQELLPASEYRSAFAGLPKAWPKTQQAAPRYEIPRISGDFVRCLPGKGRKSLMSILGFKVVRRLTIGQPY